MNIYLKLLVSYYFEFIVKFIIISCFIFRVVTAEHLKEKINIPLKNKEKLIALRKAFKTTRDRQNENKVLFPDLDERKERLKKSREFSIGNKELLSQAINNFEKN